LTLQDKLRQARDRLMAAGIPEADASTDVDLYARVILGWDRARLLTEHRDAPPATLEPRFSEWITRRERREPTAYILGGREFWRLEFLVTPAVLIPRPETEFIVEEALKVAGDRPRLADIGTGSGCIAISLAHDIKGSRVVATDVSAEALDVARMNARRHGVADRVEFVLTSFLDGVDGPFDVITANPPYVKDGDKPALSRDVRHEPEVALFGGTDGLRAIQATLTAARDRLAPGGWLVMEFGYGQDDAVRELAEATAGLRLERIREDLQGIPRTAIIRRA
jgi:release factor glutamine methyltransferase